MTNSRYCAAGFATRLHEAEAVLEEGSKHLLHTFRSNLVSTCTSWDLTAAMRSCSAMPCKQMMVRRASGTSRPVARTFCEEDATVASEAIEAADESLSEGGDDDDDDDDDDDADAMVVVTVIGPPGGPPLLP